MQVTRLKTADRIGDEELVRRIKSGDLWAMEVLYQRFVHTTTGIVAKLLRNSPDIEDVVQETFVQAYRDIFHLKKARYLERWLVRIAVNRAHRRFRRRSLKRKLGIDRSLDDERLCEQVGVAASQEARAELALMDTAFDAMTMEERTCFVLRYFEEYRLEEVAMTTGASLATVKRRISRAKHIVDRHFEEADNG